MRKITVALLQEHCACSEQVAVFKKLWPKGVVPSLKAIRKASEAGLDLRWAAMHLLSPEARKAYNEAVAPAQKAYDEADAPAWKAYNEACASARKAYGEADASALKAYSEAVAPARKDYNEAKIQALWKAMKEDNG